jgi:hypothetical protein
MFESDKDRAERHSRMCAELGEIGMKAVRKLSDRLEAAETDVEVERCTRSLQRMSRDLRLTMALEERLVHERRKGFREARVDRQKAIAHRRKQVDHAVTGQVYAEREGEAAEALLKDLDSLLDEQTLYDDFLDRPLGAVIARLCRELGLAPYARNDRDEGDLADNDLGEAVSSYAATGPP